LTSRRNRQQQRHSHRPVNRRLNQQRQQYSRKRQRRSRLTSRRNRFSSRR
jgi:hypothetical protein